MTAQQYAEEIQKDVGHFRPINEEFVLLAKWIVRIQSESFKHGLERAAQVIAPPNPLANSPGTKVRNQCRGEILREIH